MHGKRIDSEKAGAQARPMQTRNIPRRVQIQEITFSLSNRPQIPTWLLQSSARTGTSGVDASASPINTGVEAADYVDESAENGRKYYYVVIAVAREGEEMVKATPPMRGKTPFSVMPRCIFWVRLCICP